MLGGDAGGRAVRSAEHDRGGHLAARHVAGLGGGIDDLVHRLHGEVERHELDDGLQPRERRADAEAGKSMLGDRRVDHAMRAEFLQQPLGDLVGALIFGDLFAHHEHGRIAPHLLGHGVAQRLAHGHGDHLGAFRHVGLGLRLRLRRSGCGGWSLLGLSRRRLGVGCRRRGLCGFLLGRRLACRVDRVVTGFAFGEDRGDRRVDRDIGGAFGHQDFAERALVDRLDLHRRLVGLDLGDDVAGFDLVALALEPFGEVALLHRGREGRHQHLNRHRTKILNAQSV